MRPGGGGGGGGGAGGEPAAAEDEPQLASDVPMPMASIVRSIAEPPTARPTEVKKSRLASRVRFEFIISL